jgi:endonuclease YncB( thermonuclease family)
MNHDENENNLESYDQVTTWTETFATHGRTNTKQFSFKGKQLWARIVDIYDGDTITVVVYLYDEFTKLKIRLQGIDTPELRSKDASTLEQAIKAKKALIFFLTGENTELKTRDVLEGRTVVCFLKCFDFDKYGRVLADVYRCNDDASISASDHLLDCKLAVRYGGGKKV